MKFYLVQIGSLHSCTKDAFDLFNASQTVWHFEWAGQAQKPPGPDLSSHLAAIPAMGMVDSRTVPVSGGVTDGTVDLDNCLSFMDPTGSKILISEFQWKLLDDGVDPNTFWLFALTNFCFRKTVRAGCTVENCIGFTGHAVTGLPLKLLNATICQDCEAAIEDKFRYHVSEIRLLLHLMKNPKERFRDVSLPELRALERQIGRQEKKDAKIFEKIGIIVVMHFLRDLIPFLHGLMRLGAKEKAIGLIVKPYPYAERPEVHRYLYRNHPAIRVEYVDEGSPPESLLREIVDHCLANSSENKLVVIEDGGYVVPFLHKAYSKQKDPCIGAVEQTTKGLRNDEAIGKNNYHFPIVDVAKSDFKDEFEAPLVGQSVVQSLRKLLPNENLSGQKALVVGFGAIGREVAYNLSKIGMIVRVFDAKQERLAAANVRGFEARELSKEFVKEANLIIGTVGQKSIDGKVLDHLRNGAILASASSDRYEIDWKYLEEDKGARPTQIITGLGTVYERTLESGAIERYTLLADGYPINFYSGAGIPEKAIDPILAQLLIGAIHIVTGKGKPKLKLGINRSMDDLAKTYDLITDFVKEHGK